MKRFARTATLTFALALAAAPVAAQDATAQAKVLFNVGAQAYEAAQFPAAIQAFTEAYRLSPRPGILFSMAQAHRKQYFVDQQGAHVREALKLYREYIAKVEVGGRRADAVQAIADLEPILAKIGAVEASQAPAAVERRAPTRLMVSAQTREATISLDGKSPVPAPLAAEVEPGKHTVHVAAPGYFPEEREVEAAEGGIVAIDVPMREEPGLLSVSAPDGAGLSIDGRSVATTPLQRPIEVTAGAHFVAVTKRGYRPFSEDLEIGRGEARTLAAPLEVTGQRLVAYGLVGLAAAGLVTGGTLAAVAFSKQSQAQTLDDRRTKQGGLSAADLAQYEGDVSARNGFRTAAGATLAGAAVVGVAAVFLAVFDQPGAVGGGRRDDRPKPTAPPPRERPMEMSAAPLWGPGFYGASLAGRF